METDLSKAYDSVSIQYIAQGLYEGGTSPALAKTYLWMCLERKVTFMAPGVPETAPIALRTGLPQGCPTNPIVFTIVLE